MSKRNDAQETGDSAEEGPGNSQLTADGYRLPDRSKRTIWWQRGAPLPDLSALLASHSAFFLSFESLLWTSQIIFNSHTTCIQATALAPIHAELQLSLRPRRLRPTASLACTRLPAGCTPAPPSRPQSAEGRQALNFAKWGLRLYHSP